jgi:release factor glutamine methyltransferase
MTLAEYLTAGRSRLVAAGVHETEASVDIDVLAREILGWDRARLLAEQRAAVPDALEPTFSAWLDRRLRHEPVAYIVGHREFWGLRLRVTPAVLVPRPESELIVEEAVRRLHGLPTARVADIGTGSGCLAIAIAHDVQDCSVVATDLSAEALAVATDNALAHGVSDRLSFVHTSYLDDVAGTFDLIVANPPYVRRADEGALGRSVRHEPGLALFGGNDGLRDIRGVLDTTLARLRPEGALLMEFGYGQDDAVRHLVDERPGLTLDAILDDLQGIPRTARILRNPLA